MEDYETRKRPLCTAAGLDLCPGVPGKQDLTSLIACAISRNDQANLQSRMRFKRTRPCST